MAPTRTGTASQVDASAGNGSVSVTVPADATLVVALWTHWDGNALETLSGLTLNGVAFTIESQIAEGVVTDENGVGVARLVNPATGSQTLAWTWSAGGARTEGGKIVLVYVKDANTSSPTRAAATDAGTGAGNVTVTIASDPTDLVLAIADSFSTTNPGLDPTPFIDDALLNSHKYDACDITPGVGATTTVNMIGEDYSSMAAISIKAVAAGGTAKPALFNRYYRNRRVA